MGTIMNQAIPELNPSPRILLGPGPSSVHPRVLRAMSTPLLGYLDPEFITIEIGAGLGRSRARCGAPG
jgi:hypothetical protein